MSVDGGFGLIVHADRQHGVAVYARSLAERAISLGLDARLLDHDDDRLPRDARPDVDEYTLVHAHFTDRLWGRSPSLAAERIERLASRTRVTVTLHDVPQPSDGRSLASRIDGYRRVIEAAHAVAVNSEHERRLLDEVLGDLLDRRSTAVEVIPLPVEPLSNAGNAGIGTDTGHDTEIAVLGFFYPGKGHREVVEAVSSASLDARVVALGRVSDGHDADLDDLTRVASQLGVDFSVTGYLDDTLLFERCREIDVPVIAHQHFSASGSLATWVGAGRRPVVVDSRYAREMAELRPGTLTLVAVDSLASALARAVNHPDTTWLGTDVDTRPHLVDTVASYRQWWTEVAS